MGQTVLLMPDLSQMQVKVAIHESVVDRIEPNQPVRVTLPDRTLEGEVSSVASVTAPAGWWTGNMVTYDTAIKVPPMENPMPGMSAEVEIIVASHENVLIVPVAAVVETEQGSFCWVRTSNGAKRRAVELGDTNNIFTIVKAGLKEGDEVMLNPFAFEQPQTESEKTGDETKPGEPNSPKPSGRTAPKLSKQKSKPEQTDSQSAAK
jgi:multidrug efflux pump subunit AcrA (membrane-fusion protein)